MAIVLECPNGFKANLRSNSAVNEVSVECKAELEKEEGNFSGPLGISINYKKGKIQVAAAKWQRGDFASSVFVENGELCNDTYCIMYKTRLRFNLAGRFNCRVDYNGVVHEDHMWVKAGGKYGIQFS